MSEPIEFNGKVEEVTEKSGAKGNYFSVRVGDKSYLYRGESPPKVGNNIKGKYIEASYDKDGETHTSKWLQGFEEETLVGESPFAPAAKMDKVVSGTDLKSKMLKCLLDAEGILTQYNESADKVFEWNSEDVRAVGVSLFIERNRRGE